MDDSIDDPLTAKIIECIIRVHQTLGPGFIESIYRKALLIALRKEGLVAETEKPFDVFFDGELVGRHRLDVLVADRVVLELKTVDDLHRTHYAQIKSSLKAAHLKVGILVNFSKERADYRRVEIP